jgi:hypothetical protein
LDAGLLAWQDYWFCTYCSILCAQQSAGTLGLCVCEELHKLVDLSFGKTQKIEAMKEKEKIQQRMPEVLCDSR